MKKVISIICVMLMLMAVSVPAFAATTEDDIISAMEAGITVGTNVKDIPQKYIDLAEEFLEKNDLTDAQLETALADLNNAKSVWAATGKTEFKDIPSSVQEQLISLASASAKKVGATLTFDGTTIEVKDADGNVYKAIADNPIKYTGGVNSYIGIIGVSLTLVALMATAFFFAKKFRLSQDVA